MNIRLSIVFFLGVFTIATHASEAPKEMPASREGLTPQRQEFESNKSKLPAGLKTFVSDFETWSAEDKDTIEIYNLSFVISGLSEARQAPYDGSIGFWIDCRTRTQTQRVLLIDCLKYLQKQ